MHHDWNIGWCAPCYTPGWHRGKGRAVLIDINPQDNALRHLACESGGTFLDATADDALPAISEIIDRLDQEAKRYR